MTDDASRPSSLASRIAVSPVLPPRQTAPKLIASFLTDRLSQEERGTLEPLLAGKPGELTAGVIAHSPFLAQIMRRRPEWLAASLAESPEARMARLCETATRAALAAEGAEELMPALRDFRNQAALLIALADCGGVWGVEEAVGALALTADTAVKATVDHLLRRAAGMSRYRPANPDEPGEGSGLLALALGKHGARELNYSSDIDIVLFFDPEIAEAAGIAEPQTFYVRLARDLSRILQERTPDGYVFRVDLRLRPDPASTQAAVSTHAAYAYYESVGQNWERAAYIKARPVAGDIARGERFLKELAPFIWRKYFDFAAIADIHAMKRQIQAVKGHEVIAVAGHDVKLGRGGIREIEFFVQTQQLVFGGRRPTLRGRRTLEMLAALRDEGWVTTKAVDELTEAYRFLRMVEHRLQMRHDEQTQRLPVHADELAEVARFCGFPTRAAFEAAFRRHARRVESHYALLFEEGPSLAAEAGALSFTGAEADPETLRTLTRLGFRDAALAAETVRGWHFGRRPAVTSPRAREALTEVTPALLVALGRSGDPDAALNALDNAFARMPAAVELLTILRAHERLLGLFATILGSAPRMARVVAGYPHVLDGVIDPAFASAEVDHGAIAARVRAAVGDPAPSFEEALDRLRDAARIENFLIQARMLSGLQSPARTGLAASAVADAVVAVALDEARRDMAAQHGLVEGATVALLGLGRLGVRDLTATSDLDLVILYDAPDMEARSHGARPLDCVTWHQRLAQRLVTALTAPTRRGSLYDVDMRLRPSGRKGPLAIRLSSFAEYHATEAETWERMALTKARFVAGDAGLGERAMAVAREALRRPRDAGALVKEARAMRALIAESKGDDDPWDLKLARGGLTDIDFIVETLILRHAAERPELASCPPEAVVAALAAAGALTGADAAALDEAHRLMNEVSHWQRLAMDGPVDPAKAPKPVARLIANGANAPDASVLAARLGETRGAVRALFERYLS